MQTGCSATGIVWVWVCSHVGSVNVGAVRLECGCGAVNLYCFPNNIQHLKCVAVRHNDTHTHKHALLNISCPGWIDNFRR